jgi:hypothetical protein
MSYEQHNFLDQIFTVQDSTGIYLTSVDLFFSTKDESLPVTVQIRDVIQGSPSNVIIPFSEVTLRPDEINVSFNSSAATKFIFPSPVYLSGPIQQNIRGNSEINRITKEYCLVVLSNSEKYTVYTGKTGLPSNDVNPFDSSLTITQPPFIKSLFKPKTSATWEHSNDEILKFFLYRAFFQNEGVVRFFNPTLRGLPNETVTSSNNFLTLSKKILVGLSSTSYDQDQILEGVTIVQNNAVGQLSAIAGSISSQVGIGVTIINAGIGYTTGTYSDINLISETGLGRDAKASVEVISNEVSNITITNGGFGYSVGDILTIGDIPGNAGFGVKIGVNSISQANSFILDNVQGTFSTGINTVFYKNSSGSVESISTESDIFINNIYEDPFYDGLHMKVYHQNHDMNSYENFVEISKFYPITSEIHSKLTSEVLVGDSINSLPLESTVGFDTFEGVSVDGESNPGYVIIGNEIFKYTGINGNNLTGITRSIPDGLVRITLASTYPIGTYVYKYELKGISLRRINKVHRLSDVDTINHPIELDSYYIKIDTTDVDFDGNSIGANRVDKLFFNETSLTGDYGTHLSQNIQYSSLLPSVKTIVPSLTNIRGRVRTFSATSSNGNENSFEDFGYSDINLNRINNFDSPRLIASGINEEKHIKNSPGNRSFNMELVLTTQDNRVSPLVDLEEISVILEKYRLNSPIPLDTYSTNDSIRSLTGDPHACVYISKPVYLNFESNSLKVLLSAYTGQSGNIRVLYRLFNPDNQNLSSNYELFPGYSNYKVDSNGIKRVIDPSLNDGTSDSFVNPGPGVYDYEYTADDLPYFNGFSVKVIISGKDQSDPPYLNDIRAIANIKPSI